MHEGFCNFNAGTLGPCMVEGRISQDFVVGSGSDIGGGASLMGTLSGGGKERVSIGERCLVGANAGLGIALGDDCIVEAGCYVTAGSVVTLEDGRTVKARELSGQSGLLFWQFAHGRARGDQAEQDLGQLRSPAACSVMRRTSERSPPRAAHHRTRTPAMAAWLLSWPDSVPSYRTNA